MKAKIIFSVKKKKKKKSIWLQTHPEKGEEQLLGQGCVWLCAPLNFLADLPLSDSPGRNQPFQAHF